MDGRQRIETMALHRLKVRPPLECHCCFHTPLAHSPTLATTRKRPLSAEAHAGGGVAVFLPLVCHRCFHRCAALLSTEGERASLLARCSLRFPWMRDSGSRRGLFIVLRCVRPRIITAVSTPHLPVLPTLTATRSRPVRLLSAEAQAGGEVAVFLPLVCHRMCPTLFPSLACLAPHWRGVRR